MKKLGKRIKAFVNRTFSTFTVRMSQKPVLMTIIGLVLVNVVVLLISASIARAIDPYNFESFWAALLASGTWLVAPNAVLEIEHMGVQILAFAVLITGMILLTGTIIAVITTSLRAFVAARGEAKGKLNLGNHIVILNYNNEVTAMLIDLMYTKTDDTVIILSDKTREEVQNELAAEMAMLEKKPKAKLKLIVRKGDPDSLAELQDICIQKARGILVMSPDRHNAVNDDISKGGYDVLKLVLKLANFDIDPSCPIGIETDTMEAANMIRQVHKGVPGLRKKGIQVFAHNRKLGQFLALSILCPDLSKVLMDMLSYLGSTFYAISHKDFDEVLLHHSAALPVSVVQDKTYVLSKKPAYAAKKRAIPFSTSRRLSILPHPKRIENLKLFVIGKNKKLDYMLEALTSECTEAEIHQYGTQDIKQFTQDLCSKGDENTVAVILSDDTVAPEHFDANVFLTLADLAQKIDLDKGRFKIIAELLEPDNLKSVEEFHVENIIISTRIISFLATKLLADPKTEQFLEDIFTHSLSGTEDNIDIWVEEAGKLFDFKSDTNAKKFTSTAEFVHAAYYGSDKKLIPLGIVSEKKISYFCNQLDNNQPIELNGSEKIIYAEYL